MTHGVGNRIDDWAKTHISELKQEEGTTGKKLTKFDIAQIMLAKGAINQKDFDSWLKTSDGANALKLSSAQRQSLANGNIWGFANDSEASYLETVTDNSNSFFGLDFKIGSKKTDFEKRFDKTPVREIVEQHPTENKVLSKEEFRVAINKAHLMVAEKGEDLDILMKDAGQRFYEAQKAGDKQAMKDALFEGLGLTFAIMDQKSGITAVKDFAKDMIFLDEIVDAVDKFVDDGNAENLSIGERAWEFTKGAGDTIDSFIGTQMIAFVGTLGAAGEAAAAAGIGKLFAFATQGYFGVEGATLIAEGGKAVISGDTPEEVRQGGAELTMGAIMLTGTVKSAKNSIENIKLNNANISPEFKTKLVKLKGPDGKPLLSKSEIDILIKNNQTNGKPVANFEAKVEAVLRNPEEVAQIVGSRYRATAIWKAIIDPLNSTVKANPELYPEFFDIIQKTNNSGIEPKVNVTEAKPNTPSP